MFMSKALNLSAFTLSILTAITIVVNLQYNIDNLFLCFVICISAVILDICKYLFYPLGVKTYNDGKKSLAAGIFVVALSFSVISFSSTFVRTASALQTKGSITVEVLNEKKAVLSSQIETTKQQILEVGILIDELKRQQRKTERLVNEGKLENLNAQLNELSEKRISVMQQIADNKTSNAINVSDNAVKVLAVLFALCLELVPVLILLSNPNKMRNMGTALSGGKKDDKMRNRLLSFMDELNVGEKVVMRKWASESNTPIQEAQEVFNKALEDGVLKKSGKFFVKC